ncbi:MAG: M48 family metallopeptidase [Verrucomicrobiae bacterium]|nr:M48 family metallopeptidase [Verrucomicrobiae bacterium]
MDFFGQQDRAHRQTRRLLVYFVMAVVLTMALLYGAAALIFLGPEEILGGDWRRAWDAELFLWVTVGTLGVVFLGMAQKMWELSRGGSAVAVALGGRPADPQSRDPLERRLWNVVEEMAIASGLPVPDVYVLEHEEGINAFAAGLTTSDAVVGVTRGCMRLLTRDELQGVIAHEFSHVANGDMRLNLRLMGIVHGLLGLAMLGQFLLRISFYTGGRGRSSSSGGGKGGANPIPLLGLALLVAGGIGLFFGRLIKSAVSRQREFLADAAAVQFTRNPDGLVGALKKIGGFVQGARLSNPRAEEASHLMFGNGLAPSWISALSTHPPLVDRIRVWEPNFDGKFSRVTFPEPDAPPPLPPGVRSARRANQGAVGGAVGGAGLPPFTHGMVLAGAAVMGAGEVVRQAGRVTPAHLQWASDLIRAMPEALREASHDPMGAEALVYGLLLGEAPGARIEGLKGWRDAMPPGVAMELDRLLPELDRLEASARLPLVELCLPSLRRLSPDQYAGFERLLRQLIEADQQMDLFEYALDKMLRRHLAPHFGAKPGRVTQYHALNPLLPDCAVVLSVLARVGHDSPEAVQAAFLDGMRALGVDAVASGIRVEEKAGLSEVEVALDRLGLASPPIRGRVLNACAQAVASDGQISQREGELLRAIADTLDCPLPPFLGGRPAATEGGS